MVDEWKKCTVRDVVPGDIINFYCGTTSTDLRFQKTVVLRSGTDHDDNVIIDKGFYATVLSIMPWDLRGTVNQEFLIVMKCFRWAHWLRSEESRGVERAMQLEPLVWITDNHVYVRVLR